MTPRMKRILFPLLLVVGICMIIALFAHLFSTHLEFFAKILTSKSVVLYHARRFSKRVIILPVYILIVGGFVYFFINYLLWYKKKWILILCDVLFGLIVLFLCIIFTLYEDVYFYQILRYFI